MNITAERDTVYVYYVAKALCQLYIMRISYDKIIKNITCLLRQCSSGNIKIRNKRLIS